MAVKVVQLFDSPDSNLPDYGDMIRRAGIDVEFVKANCFTEEQIVAGAADADAVIGSATFQPFSRNVIEKLERCRFIMSLGIGFECLDVDAATEHGVLAANVPDYCLDEMSDHVMALLLAGTRKIAKLDRFVRSGGWRPERASEIRNTIWPTMSRLRDQTLGIVGLGRIGRMLGPKAKGFGMHVVAYDPYVDAETMASVGVEKLELDDLLARADAVSLHCALTPETQHLLGREQLRKMKPSAYLVNAARGGLVDQSALCDAIAAGEIAGAALDVVDPEPIDPDDPLLGLDTVIVTPHSAHASVPAFTTLGLRPGEEVIRVFSGQWPVGLINHAAKDAYSRKWR